MKRLFVSIPIPGFLKEGLPQIISQYNQVRWIPYENLHITLCFIGNVSDDNLTGIKEKMAELSWESFELCTSKIAIKKSKLNPMIWIFFQKSDQFTSLYKSIHSLLNIHPTKEPLPHVNLARIKKTKIKFEPLDFHARFEVNQIHLMESELNPTGAKYQVLETYFPGR